MIDSNNTRYCWRNWLTQVTLTPVSAWWSDDTCNLLANASSGFNNNITANMVHVHMVYWMILLLVWIELNWIESLLFLSAWTPDECLIWNMRWYEWTLSVLFVVGKMPPFWNNNGPHAPLSKANAPPPPPKNIMGPLAPFFQFINRVHWICDSTNLIHIVLAIYIAVY